MKIFSPKISPIFLPKLGKDQKKKNRSSLKFSPVFCPKLSACQKQMSSPTLCVLKATAQLTNGRPCRNFAYYSMLIILSWRPKGGAMAQWPPPKYAPVSWLSGNVVLLQIVLSTQYLRRFVYH